MVLDFNCTHISLRCCTAESVILFRIKLFFRENGLNLVKTEKYVLMLYTCDVTFTRNAVSIGSLIVIWFTLFTIGAISISSAVKAVTTMTCRLVQSLMKETPIRKTVAVAR